MRAVWLLVAISSCSVVSAQTFYVSTSGSDSNPGTSETLPWRTIQKAADSATPGSTVLIFGGVYAERIRFNVQGSASAGPTVFRNRDSQPVLIDGTTLAPGAGTSALVTISDKSWLTLEGLEIANYITSVATRTPIGLLIDQRGTNLTMRRLKIHDVKNTANNANANAHLLGVFGRDGSEPISSLTIEDCELYSGVLGASEALVLNGNVAGFTIRGNTVHDVNNIGIDLIGFEGTAPANDQARNGIVVDNLVFNVTSFGNPAYGSDRSAGGIYCDGCRDVTIERNVVHHADLGIEVGNEHAGQTTSGVIVRNNLLYRNNVTGLAFGGYASNRGWVADCRFTHNTLAGNDTTNSGTGEMMVQKSHDNLIEGNILVTSSQAIGYTNYFSAANSFANTTRYQIIFSPSGVASSFVWQNGSYSSLAALQAGTGQEQQSRAINPLLVDTGASPPDLHLSAGSPAIDAGNPAFSPGSGELDFDGNERVWNGRVDLGAYEFGSQPCVVVPGAGAGLTVQRLFGFTVRISWPSIATASRYDVVRGSLSTLLASAGNYSSATEACVGSQLAGLSVDDATLVSAANSIWYLLRGRNCAGVGSYDEAGGAQAGSRDAEIDLATSRCP